MFAAARPPAALLALGDLAEALMLLAFSVPVIGITFAQEAAPSARSTRCAILSSPRRRWCCAMVSAARSPGANWSCGDLLLLAEGDRVPADAACRRPPIWRSTNRCSPASPCRWPSAGMPGQAPGDGRRVSLRHAGHQGDGPRGSSWRPGRAPSSAASASVGGAGARADAAQRELQRHGQRVVAVWPGPGRGAGAAAWADRAATGCTACSPASHWRWRSCPRNSRWC